MNEAIFERASRLFDQLVLHGIEERAEALSALEEKDPEVIEIVRRLFAGEDDLVTALDRPIVSSGPRLPGRVGPYAVRRVIGAGGMGVVYEAIQESPKRTVALKLLHTFHGNSGLLRRFRAEAEVLGKLNHPGVAQVYEAGTARTASGELQPFIAMELVRGERIDLHAEAAGLDLEQRLSLIADLCDAVHHAHQHGVVHRDLKPANVIVDESGRVRVLDFGIAHIAHSDPEVSSLHTRTGEVIGTLPYMSPEQVAGEPDSIDERADVYSIGAIAYELLTGQRPIDTGGNGLAEAARRITEQEPTTLGLIDRRLRGDVEIIVGKALAKERERRYGSADELAGDIRRHLSSQPIRARPVSRAYQIGRFARRNRGLVAGIVAAFAVLFVGVIVSTALYVQSQANLDRARAAEERWRAAARTAEVKAGVAGEVSGFLEDLFEVSDPSGVAGARIPALELLDRGRAQIELRLEGQPEVRAELMQVMGRVYFHLGQYETAAPMLDRTIATLRAERDADPLALAEALFARGEVHHYQGEIEAARPLYEEALALREALLPPGDLELAHTLDVYGRALRDLQVDGNWGRSKQLAERAHRMRIEGGASPGELSDSLQSKAFLAFGDGDLGTASELLSQVLEIRSADPDRRFDVPEVLHALGLIELRRGNAAAAETCFRRCLEASRETFGPDHVLVAYSLLDLAKTVAEGGRHDEAEQLLKEGRALVGDRDSMLVEKIEETMGALLHDQGRLADAEACYRRYTDLVRARLGPEHSFLAIGLSNVAAVLLTQRRWCEAEELLREALGVLTRADPETINQGVVLGNLAKALAGQERFEEALEVARDSLEHERTAFGEASPAHREAAHVLDRIREQAGLASEDRALAASPP